MIWCVAINSVVTSSSVYCLQMRGARWLLCTVHGHRWTDSSLICPLCVVRDANGERCCCHTEHAGVYNDVISGLSTNSSIYCIHYQSKHAASFIGHILMCETKCMIPKSWDTGYYYSNKNGRFKEESICTFYINFMFKCVKLERPAIATCRHISLRDIHYLFDGHLKTPRNLIFLF